MQLLRSWLGLVGSVAATLALGCLPGCGGDGSDDFAGTGEGENVARTAEAITSTEFMDGSGTIRIRVKTCDYVSSQASGSLHNACAYCIMDSDWARVGGGAEISGEAAPGAQLMASRPDWFNGHVSSGCSGGGTVPASEPVDVWIARSRGGVAHQLRAYAVGMQIKGANGVWVAPEINSVVDSVGSFVGSPGIASTTSVADPGRITVGGGAEVVPNSDNAYLTESAPVITANGLVWRARARAVSGTPAGGVKTWVVGLKGCPSAWNGDCFTSGIIREAIAAATSGYGTASHTVPASWVTPVVGGKAPSGGGGGRYLADLIPLNGSNKGALVRSKPGPVADTGATHALALWLGRSQAPYNFNSVRFNRNGYTFYRPTGSNPQLQQFPIPGDTSAARWHLEHLGGGVYRIRNGNPDSGSECAYRVTGTTTIRVTTCGTGNEFKWTSYSGTIYTGPFQLKNATSSTLCLDNNGLADAGGSNLILKTCSALADAQLLFLDTYNWPVP